VLFNGTATASPLVVEKEAEGLMDGLLMGETQL
jgi:hypothetical protein